MADEPRKKFSALNLRRMIEANADNLDETLEEWADKIAEKPNTWETLAFFGVVCLAVGIVLGGWWFRGSGCPTHPAAPVAVVEPAPVAAAAPAPSPVDYVRASEVKLHVEGHDVVCEAHPPHGVK